MPSMSIRNRILVWAGLCLFMAQGVIVAHSSLTARTIALKNAQESLLALADNESRQIAVEINASLATARALANILVTVKTDRAGLSRQTASLMLKGTLERNPGFVGVYTCWEPNAFDGEDARYVKAPGSDASGRFTPYWNRNNEGKVVVAPLVDYEDATRDATGARKGDYYLLPRETKRDWVIEPYVYPVQGKNTLMTSTVVPIMVKDRFYGIAGVDMPLEFLHGLVDKENLFDRTGRIYIISHQGSIAAASGQRELVGKHMRDVLAKGWEENLKLIQSGAHSYAFVDGALFVMAPIRLRGIFTPWAVVIEVPQERVLRPAMRMMWRQIWVGLFFGLAALTGLWFLSTAIARPIGQTVEVAQLIARGELGSAKQSISAMQQGLRPDAGPSRDEARQLLAAVSTMTDNLASLVGQAQTSVVQLVSASTQMAAASKGHESTASEFAALTARIVAAIKDIAVMRQKLARAMGEVQEVSEGTERLADTGRAGLEGMVGVMAHLSQATASVSEKLSVIRQKATAISRVVTTITKVADQTNLLSLNAALEAQRAGPHGRGFSVVAVEIRHLADQTAVATMEIENMVAEMQASVSEGVLEMGRFGEEVRAGVATVGELGGQMGQIIAGVKALPPQFEAVHGGMKAQAQKADQIASAMAQLSDGAKQTSESMSQSKEATEKLREASRALQTEIARFHL